METNGNVTTKDLANKMKNQLSSLKKEPAVPQIASTGSGSSIDSGSNFAVIPHNNSLYHQKQLHFLLLLVPLVALIVQR